MDWTVILAGLGGFVAAAGLLWRAWNRRLALRLSAEKADRLLSATGDNTFTYEVVRVRIVNRGRRVRVEDVGWVDPDVQARANHVSLRLREPVEVKHGDGETIELGAGDLDGRDPFEPLDFWVTLTTGEHLYAPGVRRARSMAEGPRPPVRLRRDRPRLFRAREVVARLWRSVRATLGRERRP